MLLSVGRGVRPCQAGAETWLRAEGYNRWQGGNYEALPCCCADPCRRHSAVRGAVAHSETSCRIRACKDAKLAPTENAEVDGDREEFQLLLDSGLSIRCSEGLACSETEELLDVRTGGAVRGAERDGASERFGRYRDDGFDGRRRPVIDTGLYQ